MESDYKVENQILTNRDSQSPLSREFNAKMSYMKFEHVTFESIFSSIENLTIFIYNFILND